MTPEDLMRDLRKYINPKYAEVIGAESHERKQCADAIEKLIAERDALIAELEIERMRLAACGVVALSDTPESAQEARQMLPEYNSASCTDIARQVDKLISIRAELAQVTDERDALKARLDSLAEPEAEPVGEVDFFEHGNALHVTYTDMAYKTLKVGAKLYTHPPRQPVQLSDDEIFSAGARAGFDVDYECPDTGEYGFRNNEGAVENEAMFRFARAVIAAYEEKQK